MWQPGSGPGSRWLEVLEVPGVLEDLPVLVVQCRLSVLEYLGVLPIPHLPCRPLVPAVQDRRRYPSHLAGLEAPLVLAAVGDYEKVKDQVHLAGLEAPLVLAALVVPVWRHSC